MTQLAQAAKTPTEHAELEERRNALRRRLSSWAEARNLYIPPTSEQAIDLANEPPDAADRLPEAVPLRLPSSLPPTLHESCPFKLANIEFRFRLAQAEDALSELRRLLRVTMGLWRYKSKQVGASQHVGTCARALISRFQDKVDRCIGRYRSAHVALLSLDAKGKWQLRLQELSEKDAQVPGRADNESEGNRELSWIWRVTQQTQMEGNSALDPPESPSKEELSDCK